MSIGKWLPSDNLSLQERFLTNFLGRYFYSHSTAWTLKLVGPSVMLSYYVLGGVSVGQLSDRAYG